MQEPTAQARPERTTLAVIVVATLGALPLSLSQWWLAPLLLLPLAALTWVLRAHVVATSAGLQINNGLATSHVAWEDVAEFRIPRRGPIVLHTTDGRSRRLTPVSRNDLRRLLQAAPSPK